MKKYILNSRIACDLYDGDLVLANLDTGIYYSLTGLAVYLAGKLPVANKNDLIEETASVFSDQKPAALVDLNKIWEKLENEDIIISVDTDKEFKKTFTVEKPTEFVASNLSRYADMQDLLMLDPIHEVDEDGWPVKEDD